MKVSKAVSAARASMRAGLALAMLVTAIISAPTSAGAITRSQVVKRANSWVKKRVPYSQSRYYKGYRQDCSGFVSMAWKLKKSYTTRNISSKAKRISKKSLRPGDAVLIPGHISIFGGWKNRKKGTYYALEETRPGSHAKRQVRRIPRGAKFLRRKGLQTVVAKKPAPKPVPVPVPATTTTDTLVAPAELLSAFQN